MGYNNMNEMSIEDKIILREMLVSQADFFSRIAEGINDLSNHPDILNRLRVARDVIGILNEPISEVYKENEARTN